MGRAKPNAWLALFLPLLVVWDVVCLCPVASGHERNDANAGSAHCAPLPSSHDAGSPHTPDHGDGCSHCRDLDSVLAAPAGASLAAPAVIAAVSTPWSPAPVELGLALRPEVARSIAWRPPPPLLRTLALRIWPSSVPRRARRDRRPISRAAWRTRVVFVRAQRRGHEVHIHRAPDRAARMRACGIRPAERDASGQPAGGDLTAEKLELMREIHPKTRSPWTRTGEHGDDGARQNQVRTPRTTLNSRERSPSSRAKEAVFPTSRS